MMIETKTVKSHEMLNLVIINPSSRVTLQLLEELNLYLLPMISIH